MNLVLPCCVSQTSGVWYVDDTHYTNGILIGPDGKAIDAKPLPNIEKIKAMVDRRVSEFIKILTRSYKFCDIRPLTNYDNCTIPDVANKTHLTKLWKMITNIDRRLKELRHSTTNEQMFRLLYWAVASYSSDDIRLIWDLMRRDYRHGDESIFAMSSLRAFMRPRKLPIAEMIAKGELATKG
jgi:hypothetical protein